MVTLLSGSRLWMGRSDFPSFLSMRNHLDRYNEFEGLYAPDFLPDDIADFFVDAWWDGNVAFNPGGVRDDGEVDWGKEIFSKHSTFFVVPCEAGFVVSNEVVHKSSFFWP